MEHLLILINLPRKQMLISSLPVLSGVLLRELSRATQIDGM